MQNKIKVFENKQVRTLWNADEEEWYFPSPKAEPFKMWLA